MNDKIGNAIIFEIREVNLRIKQIKTVSCQIFSRIKFD